LFTSSDNACPIEKYELIGNEFPSSVTLVNPTDMVNAYLDIVRTAGFKTFIRLRATLGSNDSEMILTVTVCGEETIALADTKTAIIVNELLTGASPSPYEVSTSTIKAYFTIDTSISSSFCGDFSLSLYQNDQGTIVVTSTDVKVHGVVPAESLEIASDQAVNSKIYLKAETRGQKSKFKTIFVSNCAKTTSITNSDTDVTKSYYKDSEMVTSD